MYRNSTEKQSGTIPVISVCNIKRYAAKPQDVNQILRRVNLTAESDVVINDTVIHMQHPIFLVL